MLNTRPSTIITIQGELHADVNGDVLLDISAAQLTNLSLLGRSDPVLKFYRFNLSLNDFN
jgi:hypothetical protein